MAQGINAIANLRGKVDKYNRLVVQSGHQQSAFGELLTAELHPQIQQSFAYTVSNTRLNTNTTANDGTITQETALLKVQSSATANGTAQFQSKRHARYRPGLGGLFRFTAMFSAPIATGEQYVGTLDETGSTAAFKNGYAIGYDGTTFGVHRFVNDSKSSVALSACDDPLDGTGESRITLDTTKLNVFQIRFQYLGAGAIEFEVEDPELGTFVRFHTIRFANTNTVPSVYNPNFHATYWANNGGTATNVSVASASYGYFIEGHTEFEELHQPTASSGTKELTSVTTESQLFTIRNKSSYASKTNFIDVLLQAFSVSVEASAANNLGTARVVLNATLGGSPSYADISTTDSVIELDTASTTVTGGTELVSVELAGKNDKAILDVSRYQIIMAPNDTLTIAVSSANSATFRGSMVWKELF